MSAAFHQAQRPRMVGGYRLDEQIGSGAMGTVYRAFDLKLGRQVALKVVSAEDETSELFLRFVQEGAAAARIRHPNVVQVFNAGSEGGYAFLAMQLLEGETLADCLSRRGRLPLNTAVDFTLPICSALMAAHDAGVLHRDLKPANIFLADWGKSQPDPFLLDFGISKLDGPVDAALTQNPRFLGTPFYIAPEQADGAAGSWLSDQYSLALCLYECILGVRPFESYKSSLMNLLRHVAEGNIPSARDLDISIPIGLDRVLDRALSQKPEDRFESMRDFGAALLPFASPMQRQIWEASFITPNDATMTSANAPIMERGAISSERSGQITIDRAGSSRDNKRMRDTLAQAATLSQSTELEAERSSLSRRDGNQNVALADLPDSALDALSEGPDRTSRPPSSSRRFNSVGVAKPVPRDSRRSPLSLALLAVIGVCALGMSAWLVNDELKAHSAPSYVAEVEVTPQDAEITLDGTTLSRGSLSLVLPKDGERHELLITHPAYEPSKILFQDRPPAPSITLRPLERESDPTPPTDSVVASTMGVGNIQEDASQAQKQPEPERRKTPIARPQALAAAAPVPPGPVAAAPPEQTDEPPKTEEPTVAQTPSPQPQPTLKRPKIQTGNLDPWAD